MPTSKLKNYRQMPTLRLTFFGIDFYSCFLFPLFSQETFTECLLCTSYCLQWTQTLGNKTHENLCPSESTFFLRSQKWVLLLVKNSEGWRRDKESSGIRQTYTPWLLSSASQSRASLTQQKKKMKQESYRLERKIQTHHTLHPIDLYT